MGSFSIWHWLVVLVIVLLSDEMRGLRAEHETIRGDIRAAIAAGEASTRSAAATNVSLETLARSVGSIGFSVGWFVG